MRLIFRNFIVSLIVLSISCPATARNIQYADSCTKASHPFKYTQLIAPVALIGAGAAGAGIGGIKSFETRTHNRIVGNTGRKIGIDDYTLYTPIAAVYGLNLFGVKGRHNFRDRTVILATSSLIMGTTVLGLKAITNIQRPDGSTFNSFPSAHTAIAFMGAEFLRQEYRDVSVWYGIAGYTVAAGTGFLRIYNNRHWLTDVLAGAGVGIISTRIAYWVYPSMQRKFFKNNHITNVMALPYHDGKSSGLFFHASF